ncbi:MAG: UDP-galactopyranose mutase [Eubacterium sp.]|nr:UDP-galactopyranose mutase [Eubacterium sp.]
MGSIGTKAGNEHDYLIVGAGLFGVVFAREMTDAGKKCLVIDRRDHIAGNIYSEEVEGIQVHKYGPHIFHTDIDEVWEYVNRFARFNHFHYEPVANYKGELYNLPFNMNTFHQMWGVNTPEEAEAKIEEQRREIKGEPGNLEEQAIKLVGRDIYEKLIKEYTEKQWGRECRELPSFIIRRLPVRMRYDNNYFNHPYQGIPIGGYTGMVAKMLDGIEIRLNTEYKKNEISASKVVYTGPIDEYFGYRYGALQYRSLKFETEILDKPNYQGCAGMNFASKDVPYTRIVEHKHFEFLGDEVPKTVITKEYSSEWNTGDEPYYPFNDDVNTELYAKYKALADAEENVVFGGRLGEYKYYDMDKVIKRALEIVKEEKERG